MANLGFIGLGVMGGRVAYRLLQHEHTVTGYNRTASKAKWLVDRGMKWADSPRAVAEAADTIFVMVTDSDALKAVALGPDGFVAGIKPGKVVIDMSTLSPDLSREVAALVKKQGGQMADAPVSGSVTTLEQGKLSMMVGGEPGTFARIKPLLEDLATKVTYVGANGLAVSMKIAVNLSLAVQMLAFSEGVLLAQKSGISRETAVDVLTNSVIASPMIQYRGPFVLGLPKDAYFNVHMMLKDMKLVLEMGRELQVPLPTSTVTNEFLNAACTAGFGDEDFAAVFHLLAKLSGVPA